jgi:hypothetical protein
MLHTLDFSERHFLNLMLPIERKYSRGLRDDGLLALFPITTDDAPVNATGHDGSGAFVGIPMGSDVFGDVCGGAGDASSRRDTLPLVVVCDHLRSAFNVGSIFRTAECLGVRELLLCGYTATPDDGQVVRTSMGTHAAVPWSWRRCAGVERPRRHHTGTTRLQCLHCVHLARRLALHRARVMLVDISTSSGPHALKITSRL